MKKRLYWEIEEIKYICKKPASRTLRLRLILLAKRATKESITDNPITTNSNIPIRLYITYLHFIHYFLYIHGRHITTIFNKEDTLHRYMF